MSIDQVSVRPSDTSTTTSTKQSGKNAIQQKADSQLQQMGLEQARTGVKVPGQTDIASVSAQNTVGLRVVSSSYNESVVIEQRKPRLPDVEKDKADTSLFDFEEVASNVLKFVGGVIKGAAAGGDDQDKLQSLFEQARSGVSKGVAMARRDLGGLVNDTIDTGIDRSQQLIEEGIDSLERDLFADSLSESVSRTQLSASSSNEAGLLIRTRDGDEVTVYLGNAEAQSLSVEQRASEFSDQQGNQTGYEYQRQTQFVSVQQQQFSISVTGDIDESELEAISNLVADISDLADTFFNKDIESAYQQAIELGYDRTELAGFALQLNRSENVSYSQAYSSIQHMGSEEKETPQGPVRRVADYIDKLEDRINRTEQLLEPKGSFDRLVNGLVNQLGMIGTNELVTAINRFHSFNQQLIENYPAVKPATQEE